MDRLGICVGACLIVAQLVSVWRAPRDGVKRKKGKVIGIEALSVVGNALIAVWYNNLPGKGETPGLTYLGETVVAMGLTVVSFVILLVTLVVFAKKRK